MGPVARVRSWASDRLPADPSDAVAGVDWSRVAAWTGGGLLAGIVTVVLVAVWRVRQIRETPDPDGLDELRDPPPGEGRFLDRGDGARIRYAVAGSGPTVVLVHGYGLASGSWNRVARRLLDRGHTVVTMDLRAHGGSEAGSLAVTTEHLVDDLRALLEHLDVREAVLVGHSTGGYVAMATLLAHPALEQRLRGLVLVASLAGDVLSERPSDGLRVVGGGYVRRIVRNRTLWTIADAMVSGPRFASDVAQVLLEQLVDTGHEVLWSLLSQLVARSYYDELGAIGVPVTVVCGDADRITPRPHSERIAAEIAGTRTVWVPDASHLLNWHHPDEVVEAIVTASTA